MPRPLEPRTFLGADIVSGQLNAFRKLHSTIEAAAGLRWFDRFGGLGAVRVIFFVQCVACEA
jgi:hypothetical protein